MSASLCNSALNPAVHMKFCQDTSQYRIFMVTNMSACCCNSNLNATVHMQYRTFTITDMSGWWSNSNFCYVNETSMKCFVFLQWQLHFINVLAMCSVHPLSLRHMISHNENLCIPKCVLQKANLASSKHFCPLLTFILCCLKSHVRSALQ